MPLCRPPDPATLDGVVAAVQQRAAYLRCSGEAPPGDGWLACRDLLDDPALLRRHIDATAAGRGTDDPQVAASLFAQAYAFRVASIAVAAYALGLPGPSVRPEDTAIRIARHRPAELAVTSAALEVRSAAGLADAVLGGHLAPFIAAVRAGTRVGERLLWGNAAASIATILRAVQPAGPAAEPIRARAAELFAAAPQLDGLGSWSTLTVAGATGWYWDRTSCCLWYRSAGGPYCDDCSLNDPATTIERRRHELVRSTPP